MNKRIAAAEKLDDVVHSPNRVLETMRSRSDEPRKRGQSIRRWVLSGVVMVTAILWAAVTPANQTPAEQKSGTEELVEPIITEETLPNDPGELTLRIGAEYRENGNERTLVAPRVQVFYGIIDRLGVDLDVPLVYHDEESNDYGIGDVGVGLKCLLVEADAHVPAVALGVEVTFPTGDADRGIGEDAYELEPFVALARDFVRFSLQGNFGWSKQVHGGEGAVSWTYNWALAVPTVTREFYGLLEFNGDFGGHDSPDQMAISPGIKWVIDDSLFVALATPVGLNEQTDEWGIVTQVQVGF